jgi:hypothetical protein
MPIVGVRMGVRTILKTLHWLLDRLLLRLKCSAASLLRQNSYSKAVKARATADVVGPRAAPDSGSVRKRINRSSSSISANTRRRITISTKEKRDMMLVVSDHQVLSPFFYPFAFPHLLAPPRLLAIVRHRLCGRRKGL